MESNVETGRYVQIHTCEKGLPVILDKDTEDIIYKGNRVNFWKIKEAYESGWMEVELTKDLDLIKTPNGWIEFSCLKIEENNVKQLIKVVCKLLTK